MQDSPWAVVLGLVERFEDAQAVMQLYEGASSTLAANGLPITDILDCLTPSDRAVADALANHLNRRYATNDWSYTSFYGGTRGFDLAPSEVDAFVDRCRARGLVFSYIDGGSP